MSLLDPEPRQGPGGQRAPLLVIGVGNPDRGDDAIGPLLLEHLRADLQADARARPVELVDAYQLQPEHALELRGRRRSIIVDAAASGPAPFSVAQVSPDPALDITTHSLSPPALAAVYQRLFAMAPALTVLAVRGEGFALGEPLSIAGARNLAAALDWLRLSLQLLRPQDPAVGWQDGRADDRACGQG